VAVIDSGINYKHEDLEANMWVNPGEVPGDGLDNDGNGYVDDVHGADSYADDGDPMDVNGHGTLVAGTIAAVGNNGIGVTGVAWNSKIMALRFTNATGYGSDAQAIECINYVIDMKLSHGVNVVAINASWGHFGSYSTVMANAIQAAGEAGIIFCAAALNEGVNLDSVPAYPAAYSCSNIISVGASTKAETRASFSDYGVSSVDLFAPGQSVLTTFIGTEIYHFGSGTSCASPHVAGTVALMASVAPDDSVSGRISRIFSSVDKSSAYAGLCKTGGRLNTAAAVGSYQTRVTGVGPSSGATAGGTTVTIYGTGFLNLVGSSAVTFGGLDAKSYAVLSSTKLTAVTPAHAAGTVDVVVTSTEGSSTVSGTGNDFTYSSAARFEEGVSGVVYSGSWNSYGYSYFSAGSYRYSDQRGASFMVAVSGTEVAWVALTAPYMGKATVSLDGGTPTTVDLYSPERMYQQRVWTSGPVANGIHILRVICTGEKNAASTGYYVNLDAVDVQGSLETLTVGEQNDSRLAYSSGWLTYANTLFSGGSYTYSNAAGSCVTIPFVGQRLDWVATKGPLYGKAQVSVDGGTSVTVDLSNAVNVYRQIVWSTGALAKGAHTVKISRDPANTAGKYIDVDCVHVVGSLLGETIFQDTDVGIRWKGTWISSSSSLFSGGSSKFVNVAGARCIVYFTGTRVALIAQKGFDAGIMKVTIDSGTPIYVDLYSRTSAFQQRVWSSTTLASGVHLATFEWTGRKNMSSTGTKINVDAVAITGSVRLLPRYSQVLDWASLVLSQAR
jgi:hypothetical protein